jgi:hypothetical protein
MAQRQTRDTSRWRKIFSWRKWIDYVKILKLQDAGMVLHDAIERREREKKRHEEVVFRRFVGRIKFHVLHSCLNTWMSSTRELAERQRRSKHAALHWRRASVARALRQWSDAIAETTRHRALVARACLKMSTVAKGRSFSTWSWNVELVRTERITMRRIMSLRIQRWEKSRERRGMNTWKRFVEIDKSNQ